MKTIIITKPEGAAMPYRAYLRFQPECFGVGHTPAQAIGDLIETWSKECEVEIDDSLIRRGLRSSAARRQCEQTGASK